VPENMPREHLIALGVVATAITLAAGCGAKQELRPQAHSDPSPGYDVIAVFPARSALGVGAGVILKGAPAGRVTHVVVDGSRLIATLSIRPRYVPLDVDTQAVLRRMPSGPRRAYVELKPGHYGSPLADQSPVRQAL
jgi:ABC-type transporter Mla subunit MlaD